jgi:hypothetical protein
MYTSDDPENRCVISHHGGVPMMYNLDKTAVYNIDKTAAASGPIFNDYEDWGEPIAFTDPELGLCKIFFEPIGTEYMPKLYTVDG